MYKNHSMITTDYLTPIQRDEEGYKRAREEIPIGTNQAKNEFSHNSEDQLSRSIKEYLTHNSYCLIDNGRGMNQEKLHNACLEYGTTIRERNSKGKFGIGLKNALCKLSNENKGVCIILTKEKKKPLNMLLFQDYGIKLYTESSEPYEDIYKFSSTSELPTWENFRNLYHKLRSDLAIKHFNCKKEDINIDGMSGTIVMSLPYTVEEVVNKNDMEYEKFFDGSANIKNSDPNENISRLLYIAKHNIEFLNVSSCEYYFQDMKVRPLPHTEYKPDEIDCGVSFYIYPVNEKFIYEINRKHNGEIFESKFPYKYFEIFPYSRNKEFIKECKLDGDVLKIMKKEGLFFKLRLVYVKDKSFFSYYNNIFDDISKEWEPYFNPTYGFNKENKGGGIDKYRVGASDCTTIKIKRNGSTLETEFPTKKEKFGTRITDIPYMRICLDYTYDSENPKTYELDKIVSIGHIKSDCKLNDKLLKSIRIIIGTAYTGDIKKSKVEENREKRVKMEREKVEAEKVAAEAETKKQKEKAEAAEAETKKQKEKAEAAEAETKKQKEKAEAAEAEKVAAEAEKVAAEAEKVAAEAEKVAAEAETKKQKEKAEAAEALLISEKGKVKTKRRQEFKTPEKRQILENQTDKNGVIRTKILGIPMVGNMDIFTELDHCKPLGEGGDSTIENGQYIDITLHAIKSRDDKKYQEIISSKEKIVEYIFQQIDRYSSSNLLNKESLEHIVKIVQEK